MKRRLKNTTEEKLRNLPEPDQEIQVDVTGKLHNQNKHREAQIIIAVHK